MNDLEDQVIHDVAVCSTSETTLPQSSDAALLVGRLQSITKSIRALVALYLAEISLNVGQDQFLDALGHGKALSVSEVAVALNVRPSTVSKMADRMVEKCLVIRIEDGSDCRRTLLRLTPNGREKLREIHLVWNRLENQLVGADRSLSGNDVATTLQLIDTVLTRRLSRLR